MNAAARVINSAFQSEAPYDIADTSPSLSGPPNTPGFWGFTIGERAIILLRSPYAERNALGLDRIQSEAGIDYDSEAQIEDDFENSANDSAIRRILDLTETDQDEIRDAVNTLEPPNFYTATRPGTLLPPPLPMPERPSTISKMKDNLNFDISEWFDIDAAASSPSVPQSAGPSMPDGDSSDNHMLPSDTARDKFDPVVSFEEYLRLSESQETASAWKSNSLTEKHGYQPLPYNTAERGFGSPELHEPENRDVDDVEVLKHAFQEGGQDFFLPAFSYLPHDEEFAAFSTAGTSVNREFTKIGQEFESRKSSAKATPSPSRLSGGQALDLSRTSQKEDNFTRAGQIYVAHVLQQNPELSDTPEETNHSYTEEEFQWARNYLADDVKVWMKWSCGVIGADKPTLKWVDKALEKIAPEPEPVFNYTAGPSSQKPEEQFPKATVDKLSYWAEHDEMMPFSDLDMEWDAFEETNHPAHTMADDFQTSAAPLDAASTLKLSSPGSNASFVTADDDEMSMVPTFSTPNPLAHTPNKFLTDISNKAFSPKADASASGDLSLAPIVTKLSVILLDNTEEHATGSVPQTVQANSMGESAGAGSEDERTAKDEAHSKEMDRLIEEYDYGLYRLNSRAYKDGFGIGEDPTTPTSVQESASKLGDRAHPEKSDVQRNPGDMGLPVNPQNVPDNDEELPVGHNSPMNISDDGQAAAEGHSSPMNISDDEQEVAESHNTPMSISDDDQALLQGQETSKVSLTISKDTSKYQSQTQHRTEDIVEAQQETIPSPQTCAEFTSPRQLIHSPARPAFGPKQLLRERILQPPANTSVTSRASAPSPRLRDASCSDSVPDTSTPQFSCAKCNKIYAKKAYLLKHDAKGGCKPTTSKPPTPKPPRLSELTRVPTMKLSMTDQELIDNDLPSVQATNPKNMSYCTACEKEFSNVGRLRLHVLQSCPILRKRGIYNRPENQQFAVIKQESALGLPKSTTTGNSEAKKFSIYCGSGITNFGGTGYLLMDEGESETDNSRPFSKSDLGNLKDSLTLSNTPVNVVGADNNFAPNTINGPRPSSAIKHALFPVSMRSPDQIKFPDDNEGSEKIPSIRRHPGQVVQLTSQQVEQFNLPLPGDTDLSVMEETNIGEKVYKADNMVEIPALRQSRDPSPLKSANPALIRSTARSQNIQGSYVDQTLTPVLGCGTTTVKGSIDSPLPGSEQVDKSEGSQLPRMSDDNIDDDEKPGLKYPARMRLFSDELALSSPHKSDPLEPFEDLPQKPKSVSAKQSGGASPGVAKSTRHSAFVTRDILGNPSSITFSFTNEMLCAIATQRLEALIVGSIDPTLRSLRMWPSFSMASSASKSTFEFKVTGPENVDLVTTLRELFPKMATRMRGDQVLFVPGAIAASNSGSPVILTPSAIETPASGAVKGKHSHKMQKQAKEQPRRSSRASSGVLELASQTTVKAKMEDGSQESKEVKRRRPSSRRKSILESKASFPAIISS